MRIITEHHSMKGKSEPGSMSARERIRRANGFFQADVDVYAESVFSSPIRMYEYNDWASDSDDDADDVEWDAGITDFALFDDDRRRAQETNERLPSKWNPLLDGQNSALERAAARSRVISASSSGNRLSFGKEDIPSLTPDDSPDLRDDLDVEPYHRQDKASVSVPNYLTDNVEPPKAYEFVEARLNHEESPLVISAMSKQPRSQATRRRERPGLRHSRTMSGHVHSWRRPSMHMYTLGEEPDAEWMEEQCMMKRIDSGVDQGRGRAHTWR